MIELAVKVTDGSFDTSLTIALDAPTKERNAVVLAWLQLIEKAAALGQARKPDGDKDGV